MKSAVDGVISSATESGDVDLVSVYYRNPGNGHWFGINESEKYLPASLLKVPIMIAYFKKAESDPKVLTERLTYTGPEPDAESKHDLSSTLIPKQSYTVERLINEMIVESDNGAKDLLLRNIDAVSLEEVFTDLGIEVPPRQGGSYGISAKIYSMFFRTLYSATFLNREMSEKALAILAHASFADGLVKGVPPGIVVAHKYGEHGVYSGDKEIGIEFHDCGMVYYPQHPYLVCVMTMGKNISSLEKMVQTISRLVYDETGKTTGF